MRVLVRRCTSAGVLTVLLTAPFGPWAEPRLHDHDHDPDDTFEARNHARERVQWRAADPHAWGGRRAHELLPQQPVDRGADLADLRGAA